MGNIYGRLIELIYGYSLFDSSPLEGEVANGWFPWALKATLSEMGYYKSPQELNNFFYTLHVQIEEGLDNGTLEKEDIKTNKIESVKKVFYELGEVFKVLFAYDDVTFESDRVKYEVGFDEFYEKYDKYTRNKFLVYDLDTNEPKYYFEDLEDYENNIKNKAQIINTLLDVYKEVSKILFIIGIVLYLIYSVLVIIQLFKRKYQNLEMWVTISGILGALLTLAFGIAYETAFNAYVITGMYLSAAYPLMLIFGIVMIGHSLKCCIDYKDIL